METKKEMISSNQKAEISRVIADTQSIEPAGKSSGSAEAVSNPVMKDDLISNGYRKLPPEAAGRLSSLFQHIPSIVANHSTLRNANELLQKTAEGAYKIRNLSEGLHLAKAKGQNGVFRAMLFSDDANKLVASGELISAEAKVISAAAEWYLIVFVALAEVTGQYFMAQINQKLKEIERDVHNILSFLEDDKISGMIADERMLNSIYPNLSYITKSEADTAATLNIVKSIERDELRNMQFYKMRTEQSIPQETTNHGEGRKQQKVNKRKELDKIQDNFIQYKNALFLYSKARWIEIMLSGISEDGYLANAVDELKRLGKEYDRDLSNWKPSIDLILNDVIKSMKQDEIRALISDMTKLLITNRNPQEMTIIDKYFERKQLQEGNQWYYRPIEDRSSMELIENNITEYRQWMNQPLEVRTLDGDVYVKLMDD